MRSNRCPICVGYGKIMGGGMIYKKCPHCFGTGKLEEKPTILVDKRSKSYKDAISKLMESGLSKDEAQRVFDKEFERL